LDFSNGLDFYPGFFFRTPGIYPCRRIEPKGAPSDPIDKGFDAAGPGAGPFQQDLAVERGIDLFFGGVIRQFFDGDQSKGIEFDVIDLFAKRIPFDEYIMKTPVF
jgi:hypothetical protein